MTLLEELQAKCSPELLASRDHDAIAASVNAYRKKANHKEIGSGTILETLGLVAGNSFLDVINNVPDFRHVKPLVEQGRLIISSQLVQLTVRSMVPAVLTQAQADSLCALGFEPDHLSPARIANILDGGE